MKRPLLCGTGQPSSSGEGIVKDPPLSMDSAVSTDPPKQLDAWLASNAQALQVGVPALTSCESSRD